MRTGEGIEKLLVEAELVVESYMEDPLGTDEANLLLGILKSNLAIGATLQNIEQNLVNLLDRNGK